MEEEYRAQKAAVDGPGMGASATLVSDARASTDSLPSADDDASIRGAKSTDNVRRESAESASESAIPTIRISSESAREQARAAKKVPNGDSDMKHDPKEDDTDDGKSIPTSDVPLDSPAKASIRSETADGEEQKPNPQDAFSFSNKRLCERWLDNLFMVLYEVLDWFFCFTIVFTQPYRTFAFGRFTAPRSRTSRHSTLRIARPGSNGRFLAISACACTIKRRRRSRTSVRSTPRVTQPSHG
jgi:hypothetical protein